jgi:hypothetical protein
VSDGIAETFEAAKKETWILTESDAYQLQDWLRLLPFATPVADLPAIVRGIPEAHRSPHMLEEMVSGLGNSPSNEAESVIFRLAEEDPLLLSEQSVALRPRSRFGTRLGRAMAC